MSTMEYASVESLVGMSDRIVIAEVVTEGRAAIDWGSSRESSDVASGPPGSGPAAPGVDVLLYEVEVEQDILSYGPDPTKTLTIVYPAFVGSSDGATPLLPSQRVVMFLAAFVEPGIDGVPIAYAPLSYDNGVFDIAGRDVIARDTSVVALRNSDRLVDPTTVDKKAVLRVPAVEMIDTVASIVATAIVAPTELPPRTAP